MRQNLDVDPNFALTVRDLTVQSNLGALILDGVSFGMDSGEYVAITGPSASGKTTLLSYMNNLTIDKQPPAGGEVYFGDTSLYSLPSFDDRQAVCGRYVGYVPQKPNLIPGMSAAKNIELPTRLKGIKVNREVLDEAIEVLGIGSLLERSVLSGGEQQRVAIARALAHNPEVLMLDEPTSALHAELKTSVNEMLTNLWQELGKTIIVVTHEQTTANRIIHLEDGRVVNPDLEQSPEVEGVQDVISA